MSLPRSRTSAGPSFRIGHPAPNCRLTSSAYPDTVFDIEHGSRKRSRRAVGRIVISDNVSIDGVFQDPAGDEGFARGGWVGAIKDRPELARLALDDALRADAFLFGRRTYEWFAGRWPSRTGPLADRLNGIPKYVVSS